MVEASRISSGSGAGSGMWAWVDRAGTWTSALCVVHCVVTPLVISSSAVLAHMLPGEERTHRTLAVLVALFGAAAVVSGFRRHRRVRVMVLVAGGLGFIAGAAWFGDRLPSHAWEVGVTMVGSGLMIAAHRLNHTFCRDCACADGC